MRPPTPRASTADLVRRPDAAPRARAPRLFRALLGERGALWLALGVVALRLPGFHGAILNIDECDHVVIARMMRAGALPYVDVVETKPPLTYLAFYAASFLGSSVLSARVLSAAFLLGTVLLVRGAVRRWTGDGQAANAAGWCTLLASLCDPPWAATEIFMNLPGAAALWCFARSEAALRPAPARARPPVATGFDLFAGVAVGLSTLEKQQAAVLLPALGLALLVNGARRRALSAVLRPALLVLGFALPWAAAFGVYATLGHARELFEWTIARSFGYVAASHSGTLSRVATVVFCVGGCVLLWALASREALERRRDPTGLGLGLSLLFAWAAVSAGGRFYQHYFLQFAPPLGALAGPPLARALAAWGDRPAPARRRLAAALALPLVAYAAYGLARVAVRDYPYQEPKARAVAAWLAEHTRPDERVFVWGHFTPIFYASDRLPGTRYLMTSVHMGNFDPGELPDGFDPARYRSDRDVAATLQDLERNRTAIVVDTAAADLHGFGRIPLEAFPDLAAYVAGHYALVGTPAGARVYRRR